MTTFDKRKKGFEDKFARDEELKFKSEARRNKLLGLWAAELMKMSSDAADAYAKEVIKSDFEEPGDEDVFRKVMGDLKAAGVEISDRELRHKMDTLMEEAIRQIEAG